MTEQLEIEFKTLLSAKDYHKIYQYYQFENQPFIDQTNIYFDTPSQALQKNVLVYVFAVLKKRGN